MYTYIYIYILYIYNKSGIYRYRYGYRYIPTLFALNENILKYSHSKLLLKQQEIISKLVTA